MAKLFLLILCLSQCLDGSADTGRPTSQQRPGSTHLQLPVTSRPTDQAPELPRVILRGADERGCATVLERMPEAGVHDDLPDVFEVPTAVADKWAENNASQKLTGRQIIEESLRTYLQQTFPESLVTLLASQGTGVVFLVVTPTQSRIFKIGLFDVVDADRVRLLFEREHIAQLKLQAKAPVGSDRVIRMHEFLLIPRLSEALPALELEYASEGDLQTGLKRLNPRERPLELLRIWRDIAMGLKALHAVGFLHRDMKPANVFLFRDAQGTLRAKVGDLGGAFPVQWREQNTEDFVGTIGLFPEELGDPTFRPQPSQDIYGFLLTAMATLLNLPEDPDLNTFMDDPLNRADKRNKIHEFKMPGYGTVWTLAGLPNKLKRRGPRALIKVLEKSYRTYGTMDAVLAALDKAELELIYAGYEQ